MVQWLRLHTSIAGSAGMIPSWGTKIPHTVRFGPKRMVGSFPINICQSFLGCDTNLSNIWPRENWLLITRETEALNWLP